jgi:lambda family phage portal protein
MGVFDIFKRDEKPIKRRSYKAAQTGRLFSDFIASSRSADSEIKAALQTMRFRCRDLARNDEYARRFLMLMKTNVVGDRGVQVQVKAKNADGSFDAPGNTIIETAWKAWGRKGNCTVDGRFSWKDAQRFATEALARDGEILVRLVSYPNNKDNFSIEFLEVDLLDENHNETLKNGNKIRMGVEIDQFHRPVAYHLLTAHPGDNEYSSSLSTRRTRVPAEKMLHIFLPERAQQTRGVPWMVAAIAPLKQLNGMREAVLVNERISASKMGFFITPSGDEFVGDDVENNYTPVIEAEPGTFHQLPAGVDFKSFDPSSSANTFADFERAILRGIASGLGISYASLSNDLTQTSYSSIRQGALEDRDFYKVLHDFMIEHFVQPIFRAWMMSAMDSGSIPIPPTRFDKFADNLEFRARGFAWVDPQREINAAVIGLNSGILSMQDVANQYGRDIEDVMDQIVLEKEMAVARGITLAFEPFGGGQSGYGPIKIGALDMVDQVTDGAADG